MVDTGPLGQPPRRDDTSAEMLPYQLPEPAVVRYVPNRSARRHPGGHATGTVPVPSLRPQHYPDQIRERHTLCGVKRKGVEINGVMERVTCSRCRTKLLVRGAFGAANR